MLLVLLLFIYSILSVKFVIDSPPENSKWLEGSMMNIEWHLDNVTLPFQDVRTNINLCNADFCSSGSFNPIQNDVENNGKYEWMVSSNILKDYSYRIRMEASINYEQHQFGLSGPFEIFQAIGGGDIAISEPANKVYYPGKTMSIQWRKGDLSKDFPYGVNIELRNLNAEAVMSIQRNFTYVTHEGNYQWQLPLDFPFQQHSTRFDGKIWIWGLYRQSGIEALDHGYSNEISIDFTDRVPLAIQFITPTAQQTFDIDTLIDMILELTWKDDPLHNEQRDVKLNLDVYTFDNKFKGNILGNYFIQRADWRPFKKIPVKFTKELLNLGNGQYAHQSQFRLVYHGEYRAASGDQIPFSGYSELFQIQIPPSKEGAASLLQPTFGLLLLTSILLLIQ